MSKIFSTRVTALPGALMVGLCCSAIAGEANYQGKVFWISFFASLVFFTAILYRNSKTADSPKPPIKP